MKWRSFPIYHLWSDRKVKTWNFNIKINMFLSCGIVFSFVYLWALWRVQQTRHPTQIRHFEELVAQCHTLQKQFLIVVSKTLFQAVATHVIAWRMSTSLAISDALRLFEILAITWRNNVFRYFTLKFLKMPAYNGWRREVVFLRRNTIFMLLYFPTRFSGCTGALSRNNS